MSVRIRVALAAVVGAALVLLAGCGRESGGAGGAGGGGGTDGAGGQAGRGARVAVLSPGVAQVLRDVGCGELIVARHAYDVWSDPSLPVIGDQEGIDYESLLRVSPPPTHVLIEPGVLGVPERLTELADRFGWTIETFRLLTLDDVSSCARRVSTLFGGDPDVTEAMASRLDALGEGARRAPSGDPSGLGDEGRCPRVLLLMGVDPPDALGPGCLHDEVLRALGARQALAPDAGAYVRLDAEDVARLAPDAIVVIAPAGPGAASWRGVRLLGPEEIRAELGALGGLSIPALVEGRVAVVDGAMTLVPSSSVLGFADALERVLAVWRGGGEIGVEIDGQSGGVPERAER